MNIKRALQHIVEMKDLNLAEAFTVADEIMEGKATATQIGALLTGLRIKGETTEEIAGFARAMREKAIPINCSKEYLIDTCGSGGDGANTFNVSTISGLVAAGAGCRVAKHGNRSVSSKCGSADLLEHLGVNLDIPPVLVTECIEKTGFGFLFAPALHNAMKYASTPRKEIGIRTIFNILGPITNPAGVNHQIVGVFNSSLTSRIAEVLKNLGSKHCMVVYGEGGIDEITTTGETIISELQDDKIKNYTISPEDFGFERVSLDELKGGDSQTNVRIALSILYGEKGPKRDIVLLNAGAAIYVSGRTGSIKDGIKLAAESIDSGRAMEVLKKLKGLTNGMAG